MITKVLKYMRLCLNTIEFSKNLKKPVMLVCSRWGRLPHVFLRESHFHREEAPRREG